MNSKGRLVQRFRNRRKRNPEKLRRGIYLLPSLFTVGNLLCGYFAILHSMKGEFGKSALLILFATVLDALDGKVARLTQSTSPFGLELDSLADMISFGVAPAVLTHSWGLINLGRAGWVVSFIYVICGATRLARYNIQAAHADKKYFVGLPIPAAAAVLAATIYSRSVPLADPLTPLLLCAFLILVSILMVSKNRYRSFKEVDFRRRKPYLYVVGFALVMAAVAIYPKQTLLLVCYGYLVSGILPRSLVTFLQSRFHRERSFEQVEDSDPGNH